MNFLTHHVAQRIVNQAVAGDSVLANKGGRHDIQLIVTAAGAGTGMAGVQVAVVDQFDPLWRKHTQAVANFVDDAHGRTFLNGLTVQRMKTPVRV